MGAAQSGWPRADDRDLLASRRAGLEEANSLRGRGVTGMALEPADLHRRLHEQVIDAGPFTQHFGGAGPGATAAKDVGLEDGFGRSKVVLVQNLADELGD